jgi:hypothetical protein
MSGRPHIMSVRRGRGPNQYSLEIPPSRSAVVSLATRSCKDPGTPSAAVRTLRRPHSGSTSPGRRDRGIHRNPGGSARWCARTDRSLRIRRVIHCEDLRHRARTSAVAPGVDGRFRSGPLASKTVNIKWYLKEHDGDEHIDTVVFVISAAGRRTAREGSRPSPRGRRPAAKSSAAPPAAATSRLVAVAASASA